MRFDLSKYPASEKYMHVYLKRYKNTSSDIIPVIRSYAPRNQADICIQSNPAYPHNVHRYDMDWTNTRYIQIHI